MYLITFQADTILPWQVSDLLQSINKPIRKVYTGLFLNLYLKNNGRLYLSHLFLTKQPLASHTRYLHKFLMYLQVSCLKLSFPCSKCAIFLWSMQSHFPERYSSVRPSGNDSTGVIMYFPDFPLIVVLDPAMGASSMAEGCFNIF